MKKQFYTLIFLLTSIITFGQVNLDSGLVAKFYFNGNANDESGNGYNGTLMNGPPMLVTDRCGNPNSAYFFDGTDDFINITSSANGFSEFDSLQSTYSIALWFNTTTNHGILYSNMSNNGVHFLEFSVGEHAISALGAGGSYFLMNSSSYVCDGNWHFIVTTLAPQQRNLYIDGQLESTCTVPPNLSTSNCGIQIGKGCIDFSGYYYGYIDDIRIYNRVLQQLEIDSLYNECINIGIIENVLNDRFSIYPNPSNNKITIQTREIRKVTKIFVLNIQGKMILQQEMNKTQTVLDISGLINGIYILKLTNSDKTEIRKFIKK